MKGVLMALSWRLQMAGTESPSGSMDEPDDVA
jgi:hypothetical protein